MPELPEVETMVRGVRPRVVNRKLAAVKRCPNRYRPIAVSPAFPELARRLAGRTVVELRRLGKRIVFDFDDRSALAIEPRMTGLLLLADPPDREHLRLVFEFDDATDGNPVWFWDRRGLGTVAWYRPGEIDLLAASGRLGPDALEMNVAQWTECCRKTRRDIKVVLLDQRAVAGIGNLYASEILHQSGIDPRRRADSLSLSEIRRLHRATIAVLQKAIRHEGSTLGDGTYRNALNQSGGYQNFHRVYQKAKQRCPRCRKGVVIRIVQAQRSTFFCPACQK